jgi:hypothetical protein
MMLESNARCMQSNHQLPRHGGRPQGDLTGTCQISRVGILDYLLFGNLGIKNHLVKAARRQQSRWAATSKGMSVPKANVYIGVASVSAWMARAHHPTIRFDSIRFHSI